MINDSLNNIVVQFIHEQQQFVANLCYPKKHDPPGDRVHSKSPLASRTSIYISIYLNDLT